jgi:hypothetical protein
VRIRHRCDEVDDVRPRSKALKLPNGVRRDLLRPDPDRHTLPALRLEDHSEPSTFVPVTGTLFFFSRGKRLPERRRTPHKTTSRSACTAP